MATELYIGIMSGTSHDGIDAAIVAVDDNCLTLTATAHHRYSKKFRQRLLDFNQLNNNRSLDQVLPTGREFSALVCQLVESLLASNNITPKQITAIGCHGHTLCHNPLGQLGYSYQLMDGAALAIDTGIAVVCDFRSGDIALGGTGAPLAPAFHRFLFSKHQKNLVIANIGGIANITLLPTDDINTVGFDTGPGNLLMDYCMERHFNKQYDNRGEMARSGSVDAPLLNKLLSNEYFNLPAPKSTGRELFNGRWLDSHNSDQIDPKNQLATVTELTAISIATAVKRLAVDDGSVLVCGGGSHNDYLLDRLQHHCGDWNVTTTSSVGFDPDWIEAAAFGWLAHQRWHHLPGNLASVTGAKRQTILGAVYLP